MRTFAAAPTAIKCNIVLECHDAKVALVGPVTRRIFPVVARKTVIGSPSGLMVLRSAASLSHCRVGDVAVALACSGRFLKHGT